MVIANLNHDDDDDNENATNWIGLMSKNNRSVSVF